MADDDQQARILALTAECNGKDAEIARLRAENSALRQGIVSGRHHIALALRSLNLDTEPTPSTDRFHNGG